MNPKLIAAAILTLVLLIFLLQNSTSVPVQFLFWEVSFPRVFLLALMMLIGFLLGFFWRTIGRILWPDWTRR